MSCCTHWAVGHWLITSKTAFSGPIKAKVWQAWNVDPETSDLEPPEAKTGTAQKHKPTAISTNNDTSSDEDRSEDPQSSGVDYERDSDNSEEDVDVTGDIGFGGEDSEDRDVEMVSEAEMEPKTAQNQGKPCLF